MTWAQIRDQINDTGAALGVVIGGLLLTGYAFNSEFMRGLWRIPIAGAPLEAMTGALNQIFDRVSE